MFDQSRGSVVRRSAVSCQAVAHTVIFAIAPKKPAKKAQYKSVWNSRSDIKLLYQAGLYERLDLSRLAGAKSCDDPTDFRAFNINNMSLLYGHMR